MKPITLPPSPPGSDPAAQFAWIRACLQTIERASQEEPAQIFDSYAADATSTATRQLMVTAPTTQNLANVLAALIADFRARGVKRPGPDVILRGEHGLSVRYPPPCGEA
jgi:hypothetical protein